MVHAARLRRHAPHRSRARLGACRACRRVRTRYSRHTRAPARHALPAGEDLPSSISRLATIQAARIGFRSFREDLEKLTRELIDCVPHFALPQLFDQPGGQPTSGLPSGLLCPEYELVPSGGRTVDLDRLRTWAENPDPVSARLLLSAPGDGKARLVRDLIGRLRAAGWTAGVVRDRITPTATAGLAKIDKPLLLVIDNVEHRVEQVRALGKALLDKPSWRGCCYRWRGYVRRAVEHRISLTVEVCFPAPLAVILCVRYGLAEGFRSHATFPRPLEDRLFAGHPVGEERSRDLGEFRSARCRGECRRDDGRGALGGEQPGDMQGHGEKICAQAAGVRYVDAEQPGVGQGRGQERVLRRPPPVQGGLVDPGSSGDGFDGQLVVAVLGQQFEGRADGVSTYGSTRGRVVRSRWARAAGL